MATKKKTPAAQPLRPDLPFVGLEEEGGTTQKTQQPEGPSTKELLAMIEGLRGDLQRAQATNAALMAQPVIEAPPKVRTEIDIAGLPDPVTDPQGYAKALASQTKEIADGARTLQDFEQKQINSQQQKIDALWSRFNSMEIYKPYASKPQLVQYAAEQVVQEKRAAGLDVGKYVFTNSEQFMADVVAKIDKEFGKPKVEGLDEDDDEGVVQTADLDEGRTQGIPGGLETGGKPSSSNVQMPKVDDMFADVTAWQLKSGFSR